MFNFVSTYFDFPLSSAEIKQPQTMLKIDTEVEKGERNSVFIALKRE